MKHTHSYFAKVIALGCLVLGLSASAVRADLEPDDPFEPEDIPQRGTRVPKLAMLDDLMTQFMSDNTIRTGTLAVSRNGKVVYYRSFGWMDKEATTPVVPNVIMRVGSLTKPLVAAAVREAIIESGLTLNARVFRHPQLSPDGILDLSSDTVADARYFAITVGHLIEHKSGMRDNSSPDPTYLEVQAADWLNVDSPPSARDMLRFIYMSYSLTNAPGTVDDYSNAGYLALGQVLEELTGRSVQEYVYDMVLRGYGVNAEDFTMGASLFENRLPREPWYQDLRARQNVFDPTGPNVPYSYGGFCLETRTGQGGVVTTPLTFLRFMKYRSVGHGGALLTAPTNTYHTGSLRGTSALARQMGDLDPSAQSNVVNYSVILSKKGDANDIDGNTTRYSLALLSLIDNELSNISTTEWPTVDVVAEPQLRVERGRFQVISDSLVDFGTADVGVTRTYNYLVRNVGNAPFTTLRTEMATSGAPFRISQQLGVSTLAPGQSRIFSVSFAPTAGGDFTNVLNILSDDPNVGTFPLRLQGTGYPAAAPTVTFANPFVFGTLGSSATLIATVTGTPAPSLSWKKGTSVRAGQVNQSLVLPSLTVADVGDYTLTATNRVRAVSSTVKVAVMDTASAQRGAALNGIMNLPAPVTYPSGVMATFQWFKDGSPLANQTIALRSITGATTKTLKITKINSGDAGDYFCRCTLNGVTKDTGITTITVQSAVPAITSPGAQSWRVGSSVSLNLTVTQPPYTLTVTGMPAGLSLQANGSVFGKPTANGIGIMTIRAQNAVGSSQITVPWSVAPLLTGTAGRYTGLISRSDDSANELYNHGGSFTLDITANASFAGQLRLETEQIAMTGQLETLNTASPTGSFIVDRNGAPLSFSFSVQPDTGALTGSLMVGGSVSPITITGWRNPWSTTTRFPRTGSFHSAMPTPEAFMGTAANPTMPQGACYFTTAVATTGTVLCVGRTADGASFTSASHLSSAGTFALHTILNSSLPEYAGSISGTAAISTATATLDQIDGTVSWMKRPGFSRNYRNGIPLHDRTIAGGRYTAPVGRPILNLTASVAGLTNGSLLFDEAHVEDASFLPAASQEFEQLVVVSNSNVVSFPSNPGQVTCVINASTGQCSGVFKLTDTVSGSPLVRTAQWNALAIPRLGSAVGFFTLPQLPTSGQEEYEAPILSGYAELGGL